MTSRNQPNIASRTQPIFVLRRRRDCGEEQSEVSPESPAKDNHKSSRVGVVAFVISNNPRSTGNRQQKAREKLLALVLRLWLVTTGHQSKAIGEKPAEIIWRL